MSNMQLKINRLFKIKVVQKVVWEVLNINHTVMSKKRDQKQFFSRKKKLEKRKWLTYCVIKCGNLFC